MECFSARPFFCAALILEVFFPMNHNMKPWISWLNHNITKFKLNQKSIWKDKKTKVQDYEFSGFSEDYNPMKHCKWQSN